MRISRQKTLVHVPVERTSISFSKAELDLLCECMAMAERRADEKDRLEAKAFARRFRRMMLLFQVPETKPSSTQSVSCPHCKWVKCNKRKFVIDDKGKRWTCSEPNIQTLPREGCKICKGKEGEDCECVTFF